MFLERIIEWNKVIGLALTHVLILYASSYLYGIPSINYTDKLIINNIYGFTTITGFLALVFIPSFWQLFDRSNPKIILNLELNLIDSLTSIFFMGLMLPKIINERIEYDMSIQNIILDIFFFLFVGDLIFYWAHRMFHLNNFTWKWHQEHHIANLANNVSAIAAASTSAIDLALTHMPMFWAPFVFKKIAFESVCISLIFMIFWLPYIHSTNIKLPTSSYFMDPSNHHVHHRKGRKNGNYGGYFLFWDKLCGTYIHPNSLN